MNILLAAILGVNLFSPYISSWMVGMLPFPPGAILRDVLNVFFVALVLVRFVIDRKKTYFPLIFTIFSWSAVILWVIALTIFSPDKIQAIMGAELYFIPGSFHSISDFKSVIPAILKY